MAKRTWVAKMNCMMPFKDFAKGESVVLDDSEVTPRVKALFECKDVHEEKDNDPDFKVMVARLKAAKIPIPRGATKEKVKELFDTFLVKGPLASSVAGEDAGEKTETSAKEEEKADAPAEGGDAAPAEEKKDEAKAEEKPAEEKPAESKAEDEAKK